MRLLDKICNKLHFHGIHPEIKFIKCLHTVEAYGRLFWLWNKRICRFLCSHSRLLLFYETEVTGFNSSEQGAFSTCFPSVSALTFAFHSHCHPPLLSSPSLRAPWPVALGRGGERQRERVERLKMLIRSKRRLTDSLYNEHWQSKKQRDHSALIEGGADAHWENLPWPEEEYEMNPGWRPHH